MEREDLSSDPSAASYLVKDLDDIGISRVQFSALWILIDNIDKKITNHVVIKFLGHYPGDCKITPKSWSCVHEECDLDRSLLPPH